MGPQAFTVHCVNPVTVVTTLTPDFRTKDVSASLELFPPIAQQQQWLPVACSLGSSHLFGFMVIGLGLGMAVAWRLSGSRVLF